jgi:hypothetical protein
LEYPGRARHDGSLSSAILVEIDEKWAGQQQPYIKWDHQNG